MIDDIEKGQEKLRNVSEMLKKKYHGIDIVIDEIISQIETWYLMDDILYRPTVINLASMTSCGKTSIVRDLVKALNMYEQYLEIDLTKSYEAGSFYNGGVSIITSRLFNRFEDTDSKGIVLIDEFQKINTNNAYNEIWSLLSDGKIGNSHHKLARIDSLVNMLQSFIEDYNNSALELEYMKNSVNDKNEFTMRGWNPTSQPIPFAKRYLIENFIETTNLKSFDQLQPLFDFHDFGMNFTGVPFGFANTLRRQFELGKITIRDILLIPGYTYIKPLIQIATEYRKVLVEKYSSITGRDPLVFSKLLIFTAMNVDGLYVDSKNTDISADELHEKTLKLSLESLKTELLKVFKPEEVSRMGGNFIIYPSLSLKAFQMIINDKTCEIENDVFKTTGIYITLRTKQYLSYLEKVSIVASQGARPVISRVTSEINKVVPKLIKTAKLKNMRAISVSDLEDKQFE